jgi:hypothetical protein
MSEGCENSYYTDTGFTLELDGARVIETLDRAIFLLNFVREFLIESTFSLLEVEKKVVVYTKEYKG